VNGRALLFAAVVGAVIRVAALLVLSWVGAITTAINLFQS
jgi:hypothetical protein